MSKLHLETVISCMSNLHAMYMENNALETWGAGGCSSDVNCKKMALYPRTLKVQVYNSNIVINGFARGSHPSL